MDQDITKVSISETNIIQIGKAQKKKHQNDLNKRNVLKVKCYQTAIKRAIMSSTTLSQKISYILKLHIGDY